MQQARNDLTAGLSAISDKNMDLVTIADLLVLILDEKVDKIDGVAENQELNEVLGMLYYLIPRLKEVATDIDNTTNSIYRAWHALNKEVTA